MTLLLTPPEANTMTITKIYITIDEVWDLYKDLTKGLKLETGATRTDTLAKNMCLSFNKKYLCIRERNNAINKYQIPYNLIEENFRKKYEEGISIVKSNMNCVDNKQKLEKEEVEKNASFNAINEFHLREAYLRGFESGCKFNNKKLKKRLSNLEKIVENLLKENKKIKRIVKKLENKKK